MFPRHKISALEECLKDHSGITGETFKNPFIILQLFFNYCIFDHIYAALV